MRIWTCIDCGYEGVHLPPRGNVPKRCDDCNKTRNRDYQREWQREYTSNYKAIIGECQLCKKECKLVRDHDRACCSFRARQDGKNVCGQCWRGLICRECNSALGFVHDDPVVLLRMVDYLLANTEKLRSNV